MNSERMGRFRKVAGSEFQTGGAIKLKEQSSTDLRLRYRFSNDLVKTRDPAFLEPG